MKYHVSSEYDTKEGMMIAQEREDVFEKFISDVEQRNKITRKQIVRTLKLLQEYLILEPIYNRKQNSSNVFEAFELVCRVAASLAERKKLDTNYIGGKLSFALKSLRL